jgi:hypothetical protein
MIVQVCYQARDRVAATKVSVVGFLGRLHPQRYGEAWINAALISNR